jgi:hypothetical protein
VYFDNARKLLTRSFPAPVIRAKRIASDFEPDGKLENEAWDEAEPARIEYRLKDSRTIPDLSTCVRALWSDKYLYIAFEAPFTELTMREPSGKERLGLWEDDVVEMFVGADPNNAKKYQEFEWAPNGEKLDVTLNLPEKDFAWRSGAESVAKVDRRAKVWRLEARIPVASLGDRAPSKGTRWRANFFRHDVANHAFFAWNPTESDTTHVPERFGWLEFVE